jgi:hypothetical protein
MKKSKIIGTIGLCILIVIITISAQSGKIKEKERISKNFKDIRHFGLKEFTNMDLGLIAYFPKKKHWRQISENIKLVPVDSL